MQNQKKLLLNFCKMSKWIFRICNRKWYIIDIESIGSYLHHDPIKFLTKSIQSSHCDYSDAYILVTRNIIVTRTIAATGNNLFEENNHLLQLHKQHLKTVHHLKTVERKLMALLLIMQILLILQCLCTICSNIVAIILIVQEVYGG